MGYFTWWNFPRKAWLIILCELGVITTLLVWLYATYLNDVYFQAYANSLAPVLVPTLSVAFGVLSATVAIRLYFGMKRIQVQRESKLITKKRSHMGKASSDSSAVTIPDSKSEISSNSIRVRLKPIAPRGRSSLKKQEEHPQGPERRNQSGP